MTLTEQTEVLYGFRTARQIISTQVQKEARKSNDMSEEEPTADNPKQYSLSRTVREFLPKEAFESTLVLDPIHSFSDEEAFKESNIYSTNKVKRGYAAPSSSEDEEPPESVAPTTSEISTKEEKQPEN